MGDKNQMFDPGRFNGNGVGTQSRKWIMQNLKGHLN